MMNAHELQKFLQSGQPPLLLQVLPEEIHAASHLPSAKNACVFETAFLDQVRALAPDVNTAVIVYGAGEGSLDAITAEEKLRTAGYRSVRVFEGGLAEWKAAGLPLEGSGEFPSSPLPDGNFQLDTAQSIIRWTGRNLFNHHSGTVRLGSGEIDLRNGELVSAKFMIAMESIVCEDLADPAYNAMLVAHLQSPDFFDVPNFPTATFVANTAQKIDGATAGTPNYALRGHFTLRGITRAMVFPVVIAASEDGRRITGQGQFEFDRTEFGSQYGSGKLFRFLGKHLVNDHVQLHVKIHAERK